MTKQLRKRIYGPVMDSRQYRAKLRNEKVYRLSCNRSTSEDELQMEVVEIIIYKGKKYE